MRIGGAMAAAALALGGCTANGILLVRGTVRTPAPGGPEPLAGVTVQCREGRDGPARYSRTTTHEDGAYRIEYHYAGRWFPLLRPKGTDGWVEFTAPGYRPRLVKIRGGSEPGVARRASGPYERIDVTLVPEAAAPVRP